MSDNLDKLAILQDRINEFSHTLYAAQLKKFEHVAEVFDTELLSGLTLEQVKKILRDKVMDHINKKGINVHNVTAKQLETLTGKVTQDLIDELLDAKSDLPLSYYGSQDYLPAPFLSNFHHIGQHVDRRNIVHLIEGDDTWVCLTNTTDGSNTGVSYCYLKNVSSAHPNQTVRTGVQYRPSYIQRDEYALYVEGSSTAFILYCAQNGQSSVGRVYLVLTNGTLNPVDHTVSEITGKWTSSPYNVLSTFISDNTLYLLTHDTSAYMGFNVHSVPIDSIGGDVNISHVTGWKNVRPQIGTSTDNNIKIATSVDDIIAFSGKPVHNGTRHSMGQPLVIPTGNPGKFYLVVFEHNQYGAIDGIANWASSNSYLVLDLDVNSKTINHPQIYGTNRAVVDYTDSTISISSTGIFAKNRTSGTMFHSRIGPSLMTSNILSGRKIYVRASIDEYRGFNIGLGVGRFSENSSLSDVINCNVSMYRDYHATVDHNLPTLLPSLIGTIVALGDKNLLASPPSGGRSIHCAIPDDSLTHEYHSVLNKVRSGIPPNDNRVYIDEKDPLVRWVPFSISEVNRSREQLNHSCMNIQLDNLFLVGGIKYHSISSTGSFTRNGSVVREYTFSYDRAKLKTDAINRLKALGVSSAGHGPTSVQVVVPRLLAGKCNPFVVVTTVTKDPNVSQRQRAVIYLLQASVGMSGDNITSVSIGSNYLKIYEYTNNVIAISPLVSTTMAIREMSNGQILIGFTNPIIVGYVSNSTTISSLTRQDANGSYTLIDLVSDYNTTSGRVASFINFPVKGLYYSNSGQISDIATDYGFKAIGVQIADMTAPTTKVLGESISKINNGPGSSVILSTEAVNNWALYFTQDMSVMINGVAGIVPKTTFTLNPETDQWGEWHVWMYRTGDQFRYKLTKESTTQPDDNHLYLGYVHTKGKAGGVFRANIEKSVAIGGYRLSKWVAGKSIPVSEGEVTVPKHLNWI